MKTEIWKLGNSSDPTKIAQAADLLKKGRLVVFPTETVYGIGALPEDKTTLDKIYQVKKRPKEKLFSWHLSSVSELKKLKLAKNPVFEAIASKFYPAPFTSLVKDEKGETVGIRIPQHTSAQTLIHRAGGLLLATSANPSGQASSIDAKMVQGYFDGKIDLILDGGPTEYRGDSTVIDFTTEPFKIIRPGVYSQIETELRKLALTVTKKKTILLVCTGNTCRSPMAQGWLRTELQRRGLDKEFDVFSCGVFARRGVAATFEVELLLKNEGIDISYHRSQPLTKEIIDSATRIIVMAEEHREALLELYPGAAERIKVLGIEDPIGKDFQIYKECYEKIKKTLKENWDWMLGN